MAKNTITVYDADNPGAGITTGQRVNLGAYESAVLYVKVANKPAGYMSFDFYAYEPITGLETSVANAVPQADGTWRFVLTHLYEEEYFLEYKTSASGGHITALVLAEDA